MYLLKLILKMGLVVNTCNHSTGDEQQQEKDCSPDVSPWGGADQLWWRARRLLKKGMCVMFCSLLKYAPGR